MKTLIIFSLLLTVSSAAYSYGYYGGGIQSMPQPDQYPNYDQYQQALQIWKGVAVKRQNQVFVEPMPQPYQYPNYDQYQQALSLWQQVYGQ
jgi:uncharacterized protein YfbU (UPF0304 family)